MAPEFEGALRDGFHAHRSGDLDRAQRLYAEAVRADPGNFDALYLLGFVHFQKGRNEDAERLIGDALKVNPRSLDALFARGRALGRLKRDSEALACFDAALAIQPAMPDVLVHRADVLVALDRPVEALGSFDRALALSPSLAEAWNNRGNLLLAMNRTEEALASYDNALAVKRDNADLWNNRGNALATLKRLDEAVHSYTQALSIRPTHAGALNHRAITLFELKRYDEAARDFAQVRTLDRAIPYATGNFVYSRLHACDWRELDAERTDIAAGLARGERMLTPIQGTALLSLPEDQRRCSEIWTTHQFPAARPLWRGEIYRHERIRVAYLSADFHSHATSALMAGVFEHHDRERFQTVAMSFGPDDRSAMRTRLLAGFERFVDVSDRSDLEVAGLLREMEIDIAVDLKGYTQYARSGILAFRPAPVQVNYLGFPGTMGASTIDYIIADEVVIPPEHRGHYAEKVVWLPDTYQCNDAKRPIAGLTPTRAEAGLPERGFVFCSFNNNYKITPEIFSVWMRLLTAIDGSVLWLLADNPIAARNLRREAEARGVLPDRLVFAPRVNLDVHIARHRLGDIFLDTSPYGAHTSASDSLWAGLPVLTFTGSTFPGRVAASLLRAVGLPEMVAESLEGYEQLALRLARDPEALAALKAKLAHNRDSFPLFDTKRFTRHLETAFVRMWDLTQRGEPATGFSIASSP